MCQGAHNQAVVPAITRPLHATDRTSLKKSPWKNLKCSGNPISRNVRITDVWVRKASVDKERKFRKIKSMQPVLAVPTMGKIILLQHFNFCSFFLWMPTLLWMPRAVTPFLPTHVSTPMGTVGYFEKAWITYGKTGYVDHARNWKTSKTYYDDTNFLQ